MAWRDRVDDDSSTETLILEIHKPEFTSCPQPTKELAEWLVPGWDRFTNSAQHKDTFGESNSINNENIIMKIAENFLDSKKRESEYEKWNEKREIWVLDQQKISRTRWYFAKWYQIHTDLERDSETLELVIGSGMLSDNKNIKIKHPIMVKRIKTIFDAEANSIKVYDTDTESEIYTMLLQEMEDINHGVVQQLKADLHDNFYHPLDRNDTPDFLRILVHRLCSESQYVNGNEDVQISPDDRLIMSFQPVFFVRKRIDGSIKAIEEIIENIENTGYIPGPLIDIVGAGLVEVSDNTHEILS